MKCTLIIDVGGQSLRAMVFDADKHLLYRCYLPYLLIRKANNFVEHNPVQIKQQLLALLQHIKSFLIRRGAKISRLGLAVQRSSIVCWDKVNHQALSPVISWQDTRGQSLLEQLNLDPSVIMQKTGLRLSGHYGASKIAWCLNHYQNVKSAASLKRLIIAPLSVFVAQCLTDFVNSTPLIDPSIAARTLLFNINDCDWDAQLLASFSIDSDFLAKLVDNQQALTGLTTFAALESGVVIGDQCAVPFSSATPCQSSLFINLGTGGFLLKPLTSSGSDLNIADTGFLKTLLLRRAGQSHFALEATINGVANAINWFKAKVNIEQAVYYKDLVNKNSENVVFINAVAGLAAPFWRTDINSEFVRLDKKLDSADDKFILLKAVYESILFLVKLNLDLMLTLLCETKQLNCNIQIAGGMAKDPVFCQDLADLAGLTLYYQADLEATTQGVLNLLQPPDEVQDQVEQISSFLSVFQPKSNPDLYHRYDKWKAVMNERTNSDY